MKKLIISICSREYNKNLLLLLISLLQNKELNKLDVKFLIIFNSKKKLLKNQNIKIKNVLKKFKIKILYEEQKGISYVRNKSLSYLRKQQFDFACFLDDDCIVKKNFIKSHLNFIKQNRCDVVSGPQISLSKQTHHLTFERNFENRKKIKWASTNNVFFKRKILKNNILFSKKVSKYGFGEDQLFFLKISKLGHKIIWNKKNQVFEQINKNKEVFMWFLLRNYKYGLTGYLIDKELYGGVNGIFVNITKIIYNLFMMIIIFFKIIIQPKISFYFFLAYFFRSLGRTISFLKN